MSKSKSKSLSLNREREQQYLQGGVQYVVGIDEAGRGPLAGPVVAAACIVESSVHLEGINDSKATKEADRVATYEKLISHPGVYFGVSIIDSTKIDEINILQATLLAMRSSTESMFSKHPHIKPENVRGLIDGNKVPGNMPCESEYVIKGDSIMYSIAAASIIAKVTRDRIMLKLDEKYPDYNFAKHKGYPVLSHRQTLHELGPSPVHRFSYSPVKIATEKHTYSKPEKLELGDQGTTLFQEFNSTVGALKIERNERNENNERNETKTVKAPAAAKKGKKVVKSTTKPAAKTKATIVQQIKGIAVETGKSKANRTASSSSSSSGTRRSTRVSK